MTKSAKKLAEFLRDTAKEMDESKDQCGCTSCFIDDYDHSLSLSVGWMPGYDDKPGNDIACRDDPTWRLNAAIVWFNPADCCDLQFMDQPYDPKTGEVWDTMNTLSRMPDSGWLRLARWYLKEYRLIAAEIEKGKLVN